MQKVQPAKNNLDMDFLNSFNKPIGGTAPAAAATPVQPAVTANDSPNLFISYWIVPSYGITTRNYLVNESVIEFDLYFKYRGTMVKLFKAMQRVLKAHYEDMVIVAEGNSDSPVTGLNAYMFRVNPLVKS